jgi:hypothetical protein
MKTLHFINARNLKSEKKDTELSKSHLSLNISVKPQFFDS